MCFFFFSSRRRHTRLTCDWSSDVCSSDLAPAAATGRILPGDRGKYSERFPVAAARVSRSRADRGSSLPARPSDVLARPWKLHQAYSCREQTARPRFFREHGFDGPCVGYFPGSCRGTSRCGLVDQTFGEYERFEARCFGRCPRLTPVASSNKKGRPRRVSGALRIFSPPG